jgi:putative inorganic carbon (HCO3(-)) transporter
MALKTILWAGFFGAACFGALGAPIWGIVGYVGHYSVGPDQQWWGAPLKPLGLRYSFTLAAFTAAGIAMNWGKLRFGRSFLCRQEKLLLLFLGIVWLLVAVSPETNYYTRPGVDHPSVKLTKIFIFVLMLTHVVTDLKNLNRLLWVLVLGCLILGLQAWSTPYGAFAKGRLESVGGPDFGESNYFGAFMATMLWLIGAQFIRSGKIGKVICFLAGGFTANAIILTRSRGAVVGLVAGGLVALLLAPKKYRALIAVGLVLAGAGFVYLTDPGFLQRSATIVRPEEERDTSVQSRIALTKAGLEIWKDHPFGIGPGNFFQTIGNYAPEKAWRDAHNTYIRCLTELGIQGFIVLGLLILNAFGILRRIIRQSDTLSPPQRGSVVFLSYGMCCALATMAACCLTISMTYTEFIWWFLALPVCLQRAVDNVQADFGLDHMEDTMLASAEWPWVESAA